MRIRRNNILAFLYTLSMMIAFTTRFGDVVLDYHLQTIIGIGWVIFGLIVHYGNNNTKFGKNPKSKDIIWFGSAILLPYIVIYLYTLLLILIGVVDSKYFSTNISTFIPVILSFLSVYLFREKSFKYNCIAAVLSWITSVGISVATKGIGIFKYAIIEAYIDKNASGFGYSRNYLELHDLCLAIGYVIIFYFITNEKKDYSFIKEHKAYFIVAVIVAILGMKRIAVIGALAVLVFHFITKRFSLKKRYKICLAAGLIGVLGCYYFVYMVDSGVFAKLAAFLRSHGINDAGRPVYLQAAMNYADFSVTFPGIGRNVLTALFHTELSSLNVAATHSDIIKMYVENGFIIFGFWALYFLVLMAKRMKKRFGARAAIMYFEMMLYTFALYLSDNNEIFYICTLFLYNIILVHALEIKYGGMGLGWFKKQFNTNNIQ